LGSRDHGWGGAGLEATDGADVVTGLGRFPAGKVRHFAGLRNCFMSDWEAATMAGAILSSQR
jgi:hypothetical protein